METFEISQEAAEEIREITLLVDKWFDASMDENPAEKALQYLRGRKGVRVGMQEGFDAYLAGEPAISLELKKEEGSNKIQVNGKNVSLGREVVVICREPGGHSLYALEIDSGGVEKAIDLNMESQYISRVVDTVIFSSGEYLEIFNAGASPMELKSGKHFEI